MLILPSIRLPSVCIRYRMCFYRYPTSSDQYPMSVGKGSRKGENEPGLDTRFRNFYAKIIFEKLNGRILEKIGF